MALDMAMGGSTNTVLHILAAAQEGEVEASPCRHRCDQPPGAVPVEGVAELDYHMEDVHRAGGIPAILGELRRAGLLEERRALRPHAVLRHGSPRGTSGGQPSKEAVELFHAAPGGVRTTKAFSTENRWSSLDTDAAGGCIRDVESTPTPSKAAWPCCAATWPGRRGHQDRRHRRGAVELPGAGAGRRDPGGSRVGDPDQGDPAGRGAGRAVRGPRRRAGHAGDAASDGVSEGVRAWARSAR